MTACLTYLEAKKIQIQRTAVTTAANCCRNIPPDCFATVRDVMPILLGVLSSSDQKVLEQGCLCVSRIAESFKFQGDKFEELIGEDLLKAILRLLLPGTTNLIGAKIHTSFLRVLKYAASSSPRLATALIRMDVVDTLYQFLTGVSPPSDNSKPAGKIDAVMIMQSLIHRPKEQINETLNVIVELLPDIDREGLHFVSDPASDRVYSVAHLRYARSEEQNAERVNSLKTCTTKVRRFTKILFPTLTDAYSSTVNTGVREQVLLAQLKMLSNIDIDIVEDTLQGVSYASFLAAILSQNDNVTLASSALQAAEILLLRVGNIYRPQFYREGVFAEIERLASRPINNPELWASLSRAKAVSKLPVAAAPIGGVDLIGDLEMEFNDGHEDEHNYDVEDDEEHDEFNDHEEDHDHHDHHEPLSTSDSDSDISPIRPSTMKSHNEDLITQKAAEFIELYDGLDGAQLKADAKRRLQGLQQLSHDIKRCYSLKGTDGSKLFKELATYFSQKSTDSVTSYELLSSKIVEALFGVYR